jgi:hypothetical protein
MRIGFTMKSFLLKLNLNLEQGLHRGNWLPKQLNFSFDLRKRQIRNCLCINWVGFSDTSFSMKAGVSFSLLTGLSLSNCEFVFKGALGRGSATVSIMQVIDVRKNAVKKYFSFSIVRKVMIVISRLALCHCWL